MSQQPRGLWRSNTSITTQSAEKSPISFELITEERSTASGKCPSCSATINAPNHLAGLTLVCKSCKHRFTFSPQTKPTTQTGVAARISAIIAHMGQQIADLTQQLENLRRASADKIAKLETIIETERAQFASKLAVLNSDCKIITDPTFDIDYSDQATSAQACILELRKLVEYNSKEVETLQTILTEIEAISK